MLRCGSSVKRSRSSLSLAIGTKVTTPSAKADGFVWTKRATVTTASWQTHESTTSTLTAKGPVRAVNSVAGRHLLIGLRAQRSSDVSLVRRFNFYPETFSQEPGEVKVSKSRTAVCLRPVAIEASGSRAVVLDTSIVVYLYPLQRLHAACISSGNWPGGQPFIPLPAEAGSRLKGVLWFGAPPQLQWSHVLPNVETW
jgi:hypothetical protein